MKRLFLILAAVAFLTVTAHGQLSVSMDAAVLDVNGDPIQPHIRLMADNSKGAENLTNVYFYPEIHSGILSRGRLVQWADPNNPWNGARPPGWECVYNDIRYNAAITFSASSGWFSPTFDCYYLPGHPEYTPAPDGLEGPDLDVWEFHNNSYELRGEVPAGVNWDFAVRLSQADGSPVELFSVAGGDLETDQGSFHLSDADRMPQTIPEPATAAMLIAGCALIAARRKK